MTRVLALVACLMPAVAFAQVAPDRHPGADAAVNGQETMTHAQMTHGPHTMQSRSAFAAVPNEPGQSAFAAIQEIVAILMADPKTDWPKVDIDALRQHLVDMNNVTLEADVKSAPVDGGMRFDVTGQGPVRDSIRRMVAAHAATMNAVDGWRFEAVEIDGGESLIARPPAKDVDKLHGLGFFGVLTLGMHHQAHHLMIARGENPHG